VSGLRLDRVSSRQSRISRTSEQTDSRPSRQHPKHTVKQAVIRVIATCVHFANYSRKGGTTTTQKINLNNCTNEQLFKAISRIQVKAAATFVKDDRRIGHNMKHMTDMVKHYIVTVTTSVNYGMTREGHPRFLNWLPSEFGATKDYWEEKGIPSGRLLNATYTCPATRNQIQVHQTMNGVPVDTRSEDFQVMYQNFIAYPPSIVLEPMSELDKIVSEEIQNDIHSERQVLGPCYALKCFQRAFITSAG
jgi:hypothetical protein